MKVSTDTASAESTQPRQTLTLPRGLVGFPNHTSFELLYAPDQLPFIWMKVKGPDVLHFVVIEPGGFIPDYEPELFDEDAQALGIQDSADAMVLNIVAVKPTTPPTATANLVGPVIVNRRTGVAMQCVLSNHSRYSAHFPLVTADATSNPA